MDKTKTRKGLWPEEVSFEVRDEESGKEADLEKIADESWASELGCLSGWALTDEGELILRDDEGRFEMAPEDRFTIRITTS